jgi:hypothetical protein
MQTLLAHQPLDGAARNRHAFTFELTPDLVRAIGLHVGLPHSQNFERQLQIALFST